MNEVSDQKIFGENPAISAHQRPEKRISDYKKENKLQQNCLLFATFLHDSTGLVEEWQCSLSIISQRRAGVCRLQWQWGRGLVAGCRHVFLAGAQQLI